MKSLGQLLRERREAFGFSLEETARWWDQPPEWLENIEAGDDLSVTDFERICHGLAISPSALLSGEGDSPARGVARFRSAMEDSSFLTSNDLRLIATASEIGLTLAGLLAIRDEKPSFDRYRNLQGLSQGVQPWEHGYQLGEAARAFLVPSTGPISNLESTLMGLGIHIARVRFSTSKIEAAGVWESGAVPVILLNTSATRVRYSLSRRAILAHELCHLLHDGGEANMATRVTCEKGTDNYQEAIEQRARGFAPAFLAPRRQVKEWSKTHDLRDAQTSALVQGLAARWGLSFEGAIWHAKNCDLIQPEIADKLSTMEFQANLPTDQFEREEIDPPIPSGPELKENLSPLMKGWAAKLVVEALKDSIISLGRAKELLAWRYMA